MFLKFFPQVNSAYIDYTFVFINKCRKYTLWTPRGYTYLFWRKQTHSLPRGLTRSTQESWLQSNRLKESLESMFIRPVSLSICRSERTPHQTPWSWSDALLCGARPERPDALGPLHHTRDLVTEDSSTRALHLLLEVACLHGRPSERAQCRWRGFVAPGWFLPPPPDDDYIWFFKSS